MKVRRPAPQRPKMIHPIYDWLSPHNRRLGEGNTRDTVQTRSVLAFGLKNIPFCVICRGERMIDLVDRYGRVHESDSGYAESVFPISGFLPDGFGLSVQRTAAQNTRGVIITRDRRRRVPSAGADFANWKVID
jgi:hypothetical protein